MIIKNRIALATSKLRKQALEIIEAGLNSVLPSNILINTVHFHSKDKVLEIDKQSFPLGKGRIFVIGGGKASGLMAETLEGIIGSNRISAGIVNCKDTDYQTKSIQIVLAGHPIPDEAGIDGVRSMLALKESYGINEEDIVICLISGGGSSLMPWPVNGVSLHDMQTVTSLLLKCGADIGEINAVRKHISRIKGGRLGQYFAPARVASLILSDVIGNNLDVIASGPTYPDSSTFQTAQNILEKYQILEQTPPGIRDYLSRGLKSEVSETPKELSNCANFIIGDNQVALKVMASKAISLGLNPKIVTSEQQGDTGTAASLRADEIINGKYGNCNAILLGGETTPTLPPDAGKGGRNQHYAASSILQMADFTGNWLLASIGTDGSDFLSDIAGAIVDNDSLAALQTINVDIKHYLDKYDSYNLLVKLDNSLVVTGNTGTNVGDVILYLLQ